MTYLPPLNWLRAFEAAGRRLNFRAAADELGVTQSAVAQQVRQLETHLELPLFERLPQGLAFTSSGRGYHVAVAAAFENLRAATDNLKPEPDKVLISVTPTFAAKWLIPNLPDFAKEHPDVDLRILATEKISSFHGDNIDLAIRQGAPPFGAAIDAQCLFRQEIIAVAAPTLIAGQSVPLHAKAVSELPKLHDAHDLWPEFLRVLGVKDHGGHGVRLNQTALAVDAALAGQGVALVSRFMVTRDLAAGHLVQVTPESISGKQDFYLLAERKPRADKAIAGVINWFVSQAKLME